MKGIRTILAFVMMALYACQATNTVVDKVSVDLDKKGNKEMAQMFEISEIVPVDSMEYMLSDVSSVKTRNNRIYILDYLQKRILLLTPVNNELRIVVDKKGIAHDEYVGISGFSVAPDGDLYILDNNSQKVIVYDADGKYKRTIRNVDGNAIAVNRKGQIGIHCLKNGEGVNVEILSSEGKIEKSVENNGDYQTHNMVNGNEIIAVGDDFYYCNSFDLNIYKASEVSDGPVIEFDFGKYQSDMEKIRKIKPKDFPGFLLKDKGITNIEQICSYKEYLFFATSRMDQVVYNMKKRKAVCLSSLPHPYDLSLVSPITVTEDGAFYVFVRGNNVQNALLPYLEHTKNVPEGWKSVLEHKDSNAQDWLLKGRLNTAKK